MTIIQTEFKGHRIYYIERTNRWKSSMGESNSLKGAKIQISKAIEKAKSYKAFPCLYKYCGILVKANIRLSNDAGEGELVVTDKEHSYRYKGGLLFLRVFKDDDKNMEVYNKICTLDAQMEAIKREITSLFKDCTYLTLKDMLELSKKEPNL